MRLENVQLSVDETVMYGVLALNPCTLVTSIRRTVFSRPYGICSDQMSSKKRLKMARVTLLLLVGLGGSTRGAQLPATNHPAVIERWSSASKKPTAKVVGKFREQI